MAFPSQWMDQLLAKNDIVDVVSSYVELKPKGRKLWACCPLHGEKTPSFAVTPEKGLFYCFGCHAGGSVIQFIMSMERLDFPETVKFLAERAHMELPEEQNDRELQQQKNKRRRLEECNRLAARYFCEQLLGEKGQLGRAYALKRKMDKSILLRFGIGYAPEGWDNLLKHLTQAGYKPQELVEAGLAVENPQSGRIYDAYRNRLIFPIQGISGQVLGFGGRVLDDSKPKYINTGDTPLYNKRANLYGLHLLKSDKLHDIIMVEGYMDVIGLYQAGVENAVASLGTALTEQQARLLKRYVSQVYIAYDGDAAGQNATLRGLEILSAQGLSVRVIVFPNGMDPDEFAHAYGKAGFDRLKAEAMTLSSFKLSSMAKAYDLKDENQKERYSLEACRYIAGLQPIEQPRYYQELSERTGYAPGLLQRQGSSFVQGSSSSLLKTPAPRPLTRKRTKQEESARQVLERTLLQCALLSRKAYLLLQQQQAGALLEEEAFKGLFEALSDPHFHLGSYVAQQQREQAELLSTLLKGEESITEPEKAAEECLKRIQKKNNEEKLLLLQQRLAAEELPVEERNKLLQQITQLIRTNK